MNSSIGLHFIKLFFLINGLQALSFYKFDIETIKINRTRNVAVAVEKKFDDYQALKEFKGVCQFSSDCRPWAYVCREHLCECADGYKPDAKNETCVGGIGRTCTYDSHCISHAYCKAQVMCACKAEYPLESEDKWYCDDDSPASKINLSTVQIVANLLSIALLQKIMINI